MPYEIRKNGPAARPWCVVNKATGAKAGCHPTKKKAQDHLTALVINVPEAAAAAPEMIEVPALVTLAGVDIVAAGTWPLASGTTTFTSEDLAAAIDAAACPSIGPPAIKIGHVDPRFDGEPAVGRVVNMELAAEGNKIRGDLAGMPGWLGEIASSAYPRRSIEALRDVTCQQGHHHAFVITSLALLGITRQAVGVLSDLDGVAALYGISAAEQELPGEKVRIEMAGEKHTAAGVTVDDVRKQYMQAAGYSYWITEIQLDPPQLIVCDEGTDKVYRVPMKIKNGTITFSDPIEVEVEFVDIAAKAAEFGLYQPAAHYASVGEFLDGLEPEIVAAWDAAQAKRNLGDSPSASQLKALFALPGDTKSASKLPHHDVSSDGKVGAANLDGCSAAIAAINGSHGGLAGVSDAQKRTAYSHLAAHIRAGGGEPPELKAAAAGHAAYTGTHTHPHSAFGSQGGDATHEHPHVHAGDAVHRHDHQAAATGPETMPAGQEARTSMEAADMEFSKEQMAALRAALGKGDEDDLTPEEILAAIGKQAEGKGAGDGGDGKAGGEAGSESEGQKLAASAKLPPGVIAIDSERLESLQASARKGEEALRRMQAGERDQVIAAAMAQGKFSVARKALYERMWEKDPEGTRQVIASLQRNAVPVADIGAAGGDPEDDWDEEFKSLFRPGSLA